MGNSLPTEQEREEGAQTVFPDHDKTSKERAYCGVVVSKKLKLTALFDENQFQ